MIGDKTIADYDTLERYRPIQVAYWLVNPYYERIYGQVDDKKDLLELRNEFLSKEFWEYVLERLNNVIDQGKKKRCRRLKEFAWESRPGSVCGKKIAGKVKNLL